MAIYKSSNMTVTAPAAGSAGVIVTPGALTLTPETYSLASGTVKDGSSNAIVGAAVILVEIIASPASELLILMLTVNLVFLMNLVILQEQLID